MCLLLLHLRGGGVLHRWLHSAASSGCTGCVLCFLLRDTFLHWGRSALDAGMGASAATEADSAAAGAAADTATEGC